MAAGKFFVEMSTLGDSIGAAFRRGVGKLKSVFSKQPSGDRVTSIAYNLLLIGETGSGKTSFLNLLCNFNEVLQHGFDQAISQKRLRRFNDHQKEDLEALEMQSKTGQTSHYTIEIDGLTLGIIDTPGFGDTRGIEHDKKNVKNIVDKVNAVTYIHCICLVMNGRQSRLTHQLKYVVSEISAILPKSCVYNMIVVLTNVRDSYETSFRLEELVPYLGEKVKQLQVVYIENPFCLLEKMSKNNDINSARLKDAFQTAATSLEAMLEILTTFEMIYTNQFFTLHVMKEAIERQTADLFVAIENKGIMEKKTDTVKDEITKAKEAKELSQDFNCQIIVWNTVNTPSHNTVCATCNSNCHVPCYLPMAMDSEPLKYCPIMNRETCNVCNHSYRDHMHQNFIYEQSQKTVIDETKKATFDKAEKSIQDLGLQLQRMLDETLKLAEEQIEQHRKDLYNKINNFEEMASTLNYIMLLECEIKLIEHRIAHEQRSATATSSSGAGHLIKAKEHMEGLLHVVKDATKYKPSEESPISLNIASR